MAAITEIDTQKCDRRDETEALDGGSEPLSAFTLLWQRRGAPVDPAPLLDSLSALDHRGRDGSDVVIRGPLAVGHQHFWTTPEEVGERQPLVDEAAGLVLVFDGRIDNRDELIPELEDLGAKFSTSDAQLVMLGYQKWRDRFTTKLLGSFTLGLVDERRGCLTLARDPMGDRVLYFHDHGDWIAVASEEAALLAFPGISTEIDMTSVARLLAFEAPAHGATYFREISEIREGEVIVVDERQVRRSTYWRPKPEPDLRLARDEEYAEWFGDLLTLSLRARMRAPRTPAVMMSGGLDSTTVASLAARELRSGSGARLKTYSWVFDELSSCDERTYMDMVIERWGLDASRVVGDHAWPMSGAGSTAQNPNVPLRGAYRELRDSLFDQAAHAGERVLLTGEFADELYTGREDWLRDLTREGRWLTALREVARGAGEKLLLRRRGIYGLRGGTRRLLSRGSRQVGFEAPPWLTAGAKRRLRTSLEAERERGGEAPVRLSQHRNVFHRLSLLGALSETFDASRRGLELRRPYRDRRLVEFMLSVPAHQLFRPGWPKWILRRATKGISPEALRRRRVPTSLQALFERGFFGAGKQEIRRTLLAPDALWREFIPSRIVDGVLAANGRETMVTRETLAVWSCVGLELWHRSRAGTGGVRLHNEITLKKEVGA